MVKFVEVFLTYVTNLQQSQKTKFITCNFQFDGQQMKTDKWFFMRYLLSAIWRFYFHPAKFDNFKDEKMSDYKTASAALTKNCWSKNLLA